MPTTAHHPRPAVDGLLVDMDGLFRHWRDTGARLGERRADLPAGTFDAYAYRHPSYRLAQLGVLTDQQWADDVAARLVDAFGPRALEAIGPWRADRGEIDPVMLDLLAQARRHVPVGVLTNTTTAFRADLAHHGIANVFDFVFPTAELGVDKPAPLAFHTAARKMGIAPDRLFFTDDEPPYVAGALHAGLNAEVFTGPKGFAAALTRIGVPVTAAQALAPAA
ncbi:HAD family hydrolase [Kitasatospora sp. NPDC094011]|uniref:HAD family hydrolase n=1 Tax=Kitasatospora sp. NPDC094011 TaxID=3364090 RepID=UPI003807278D